MATHCLYIVGILYVGLWIIPLNGNKDVETGIKVGGQDGHHIVAQKNGKLLLNCSVEVTGTKFGTPVVTWRKDGELVTLDNRIQKVQNGSLFFRRVQHKKKKNLSDEGVYECLVQNNIGSIIASRVKLEVASIAKSYSEEPQDQEVEEGGVARFECKIKAVPPPLYTWIKDEVQLTANDRYNIINSGILQISNVTKQDDGHYSCTATPGGLYHLPDTVDSIRWKLSSEAYLTVKSGNKPRPARIVAGPSDTVAQTGQTVVLECLVDGNPRPTVRWRRDDGKNMTRAVVQRETNLKLLELKLEDSGSYICEVSSQNSPTITAKAMLIVATPPVIIKKPENIEWPVSRLARFSCDVEGNPKPVVTWYKNGQMISKNDGKYQLKDNGQLVVPQTVLDDSGYYQCIAENTLDFATAFARLAFTAKEEAPRPPDSVKAVVRSSTSIDVSWSPAATQDENCQVLAYSVTLKKTDTNENVDQLVLVDSTRSFKDLECYTSYTVLVRAYTSKCGASDQFASATVRTLESVPSKAPLIRLASTTPNTILVSWDPLMPKDRCGIITEYTVHYMKVGDKIILKDKALGTATSFLITGLSPDTVYHVRVLAATKEGYSRLDDSNWPWVDYRTPSRGNLPSPPNIKIVQVSTSVFNVSWQHANNEEPVTGFLLTLKKQISGEEVQKVELLPNKNSYVFTNLENNTIYAVQLVAQNQHGDSGPVVDEFRTSEDTTPKDLKATITTATSVHLTWERPNLSTDIEYYTIKYYKWNNGIPPEDSTMKNCYSQSIAVEGLKPYTSYVFEVQAHTSDGNVSPFSTPVILKTKEDVPSPPVDMSALMRNGNIIVTWKPPMLPNGNITTYVILYQLKSDEEPQGDWRSIKINGTFTSWNLQYQEGRYYYLKMMACTGAGPSNSTGTIIVPQKTSDNATLGGRSSDDQKIGIIIGCLIGVVCIVICILIILCRNRCFSNSYPQTQTTHFHCNGHVPHHGNGHATRLAEQNVLDHHQMEQFTPILSENEHCDSKGCVSGNLIVTPNGTRINGYVPFKNGMRNGHIPNGRVTTFSGKGEIGHPEETRGLIAYMLASSDGSHTSEEGHQNVTKCQDKSSLEDIDRSLEEDEELPHITYSSEKLSETSVTNQVSVLNAQPGLPEGDNCESSLPLSSLRSSAQNQQSTSSSPLCQVSMEMDVNPHTSVSSQGIYDEDSSCRPHTTKGSNKQPQLHTSVKEEQPQSNTSDSLIPSFRNGRAYRTSNNNTSQPEGPIPSRAQEEATQGCRYQPPPPPYPGKKRCYANTSPQELCINGHVDA